MKIYKIKATDELVIMCIESRRISKVLDMTGAQNEVKTLNLVKDEEQHYRAVMDDELEFVEEVEE